MSQATTSPSAAALGPSFTLTDADGALHGYEVRLHPPTEGTEIMFTLIALGAEPFASVIQSAFEVEDMFAGKKLEDLLDFDLEGLVGKIEWGKVGGDVKRSILSMPMSTLVREILKYTFRDGKQLHNDITYNAAYVANYSELLQAVWEVAQVNRFFPQLSTSEDESEDEENEQPPE